MNLSRPHFSFLSLLLLLFSCSEHVPVTAAKQDQEPAPEEKVQKQIPDKDTGDDDTGQVDRGDNDSSNPRGREDGVVGYLDDKSGYFRKTFEHKSFVGEGLFTKYNCLRAKRSSPGKEVIVRVDVTVPSMLMAMVSEKVSKYKNVDIFLLDELDPEKCKVHHNSYIRRLLLPGTYYVVYDNGLLPGGEVTGPRPRTTIRTSLRAYPKIDCAAAANKKMEMRWKSCHKSVTRCSTKKVKKKTKTYLQLPAVGKFVKEAHLVTKEGNIFPKARCNSLKSTWPKTIRDGVKDHYKATEAATAFIMNPKSSWAPQEKSQFGQGSSCSPLPIAHEPWYVNMMWRKRPAKGTRMLVYNPKNHRAVVVVAGYETGPYNHNAIGGFSEETHHFLRTRHRHKAYIAMLPEDMQGLPPGPVRCKKKLSF